LTVHCDEATQLASDALDRELSLGERLALRGHLFICHDCRGAVKQMRAVRRLLQQMPDQVRGKLSNAASTQLPPERREQIKHVLASAEQQESN
jgi:hypothetical protein